MKKGCLVTNTINELSEKEDPILRKSLLNFSNDIKRLFTRNLEQDKTKNQETIKKQANYLMTSMFGLSIASKILNKQQLEDFIETAFENL